MSITKTIEVPDSHRLTIEAPHEIPAGPVVLTFTPEGEMCSGGSRDTPEYPPAQGDGGAIHFV
jgi:hypothetical protein